MSDLAAPILLAHAPTFALDRLTVRPSTREVVREDGVVEVIEPRVMQVLVALHRADGAIVARDDLTRSCWEGRVVGEDAINRVISRLRRTAAGIGEGAFRVETVTKVGYRLVTVQKVAHPAPPASSPVLSSPARMNRRLAIGGGVLVALGGATLSLYGRRLAAPTSVPDGVALDMAHAIAALRQSNPEAVSQAIGTMQRLVALHPGFADGWGLLGVCYASALVGMASAGNAAFASRAQAAILRARALDRDNGFATAAEVQLMPRRGAWLQTQGALKTGLAGHPNNSVLMAQLASSLMAVGEMAAAADLFGRVLAAEGLSPGIGYLWVIALWSADRLEEADRAMTEIFQLYPMHFAVWFTRFYLLMYSARADQAIAQGEQLDSRPLGIPAREFDRVLQIAPALRSHAPAEIRAALVEARASAPNGAGLAENGMQFSAALGDVDQAFAISEAYFFGRGFTVADLRFGREQRVFSTQANRRTHILFLPSTVAMRADPRFAALVRTLGLEDFWRRSGVQPDFRRA